MPAVDIQPVIACYVYQDLRSTTLASPPQALPSRLQVHFNDDPEGVYHWCERLTEEMWRDIYHQVEQMYELARRRDPRMPPKQMAAVWERYGRLWDYAWMMQWPVTYDKSARKE